MALDMTNTSIGVSREGMTRVKDAIKVDLIGESTNSINTNVDQLNSNIDNYWHGAAADAFKMKVDSERAKVITILNVLEAKMELDLGAMATNSAIADAEIAEAIFGTMGGGSYSGGGGSFGGGLSGLSGGSISSQNSASSSSPHNNADTAPRAQRSENSFVDAVQNSGIYSDDPQKQNAASQALADSSTGSVYVIDDLGSLKGGAGVIAYDEQGNKTIFRISEDGVPHGHQLKEGLVYTISDPTELNPNSPFVKLDSDGGYAYARTNSGNPGPTVISINDSSLNVQDLGDSVKNSGIYSDDLQKQSAASQALADSSTGSVYVIDDLGSLKGGAGVIAYDEQGNKTIFRISEDGVPHGHQLKEGLVYTISDPTELNPNSPFVKLDSDGGYAYARTNSDNPGPTVISINDSSLSVDDLGNPNSSGLSVDVLARNSASRTPDTDTSANNTRISVQDLGNNYSPNLTIDEMAKNIDVD